MIAGRGPIVMKFGGTSVHGAEGMRRVADVLKPTRRPVVVVVSAMAGVTDQLIAGTAAAARGQAADLQLTVAAVRRAHLDAARSTLRTGELARFEELLEATLSAYLDMASKFASGQTPSAPALDAASSLGEVLSANLLAATLRAEDVAATAVDAADLIVTDEHHGAAAPIIRPTEQRVRGTLRPLLDAGTMPVVTGFRASTAEGVCTTLGRGGSDFSATIIGTVLPADEVWIWTDVDGIMTADPRLVPGARVLPEVSYAEAGELAFFGAKVLHHQAVRLPQMAGIPVLIRNCLRPDRPGTRIDGRGISPSGVRAVTHFAPAALVTISARSGAGINRLAADVFGALEEARISTLLVTQSSAEEAICVAIPQAEAEAAASALGANAPAAGAIDVQGDLGIVVLVGEAMRGTPGVSGRMFGVLGELGINVTAIAQGSSELGVAAVVRGSQVADAVRGLHREFVS